MGSILGAGYTAFAQYERVIMIGAGSPLTFLLGRSDLFGILLFISDYQFYAGNECYFYL
jgi:hypothetical protein